MRFAPAAWRDWNFIRSQAVDRLSKPPEGEMEQAKRRLDALKEVQPIGTLNLIISQVIAVLSFGLPIVKGLIG